MADYRVLASNLKDLADSTIQYFILNNGAKNSNIKIEAEVHPDISFRPTLSYIKSDGHIVCAEVIDAFNLPEIERFVLACKNNSLPVLLYIVIQKDAMPQIDTKILKTVKDNGVAILEINPPNHGTLITNAPLSLSLGGLRSFKLSDFPSIYREPLNSAINTFKQGNPGKGCSEVYDEIESLTRRIGKKISAITNGFSQTSNFNWDTHSWALTIEFMRDKINRAVINNCPELKTQLFNRLLGLTEYRNAAGHKPTSLAKLIERDKQLRTRFESAVDELNNLIRASKPLRL